MEHNVTENSYQVMANVSLQTFGASDFVRKSENLLLPARVTAF